VLEARRSALIVVFWFPELARCAFLLHHATRLFKRANAAPGTHRLLGWRDAEEPVIKANPSTVRRSLNGYEFWHWPPTHKSVAYKPLFPKPPISFAIVKNTKAAVAKAANETTDPLSMSAPWSKARAKVVLWGVRVIG